MVMVAILPLAAPMALASTGTAATGVEQMAPLGGTDRYDRLASVVATRENYPPPRRAGRLVVAGFKVAPLLLTTKDAVPAALLERLKDTEGQEFRAPRWSGRHKPNDRKTAVGDRVDEVEEAMDPTDLITSRTENLASIQITATDQAVIQVAGYGSTQQALVPPMKAPTGGYLGRIRRGTWAVAAGVIAGLVLAVIFAVAHHVRKADSRAAAPRAAVGARPTSDPSQTGPGMQFHVQNDFRKGAWSRTTPNDGAYYSRDPRPSNGREWLDNGTVVHADCWVGGEGYDVALFTTSQTWSHWARLAEGGYLQMSLFSETTSSQTEDIPGLERCA